MYLDKRSFELLEELILNPKITSKEMEIRKQLSRRQIKYSFEKINNWLQDNNYPKIKRLNSGNFIVDATLNEIITQKNELDTSSYIPSENERVLLLLFIMMSQKNLSLFHFTHALKVSNVTVLNDMKEAQRKVKQYQLEIHYSRCGGYVLEGNEWHIRNLLHDSVQEIRLIYSGLSLIQDFTLIPINEINNISMQLEKIEEVLKIKFTDEKFQLLPYYLGIIFKRIEQGFLIEVDYQIKFKELSGTKEFEATELLVENDTGLPEVERLYITLQLLSANIFSSETLAQLEIPQLKNALFETLNNVERLAFIKLKSKEMLVKRLMLHLKPAYYRMKYNLTSYASPAPYIDDSYLELDSIVERSLKPLEEFIKSKIPQRERHYITIFIGGHLLEAKQILTTRKKAIVLCQNGVTVSKLLRNTLTKLFPEFDFFPTMSLRQFNEIDHSSAEIIFSPIPVTTNKYLFIVNPLLQERAMWNLRQRVMKKVFGYDQDLIDVDKLIDVIQSSTNIVDKNRLKQDLQSYFQQTDHNNRDIVQLHTESHPNLNELLTPEMIAITNEVESWKEAIQLASIPLLKNNVITENYVNKMIEAHNYHHPYMVLGEHMAIPHAEPEEGVNRLGMSLLVIKKGIHFSERLKIHLVVVIAPTDTEEHVKAIYQLTNLSMDQELLKKVMYTSDKKTITQLLEKLSQTHRLEVKEVSGYEN
ncbi:BglG family transcription antiterminator [Oceanobacillus sp. M65]|uniref:BglG family transcription antiterminator n=1 Tax=Oceanobacillus sp. M65 TaxID=3457435 RepID=UPI003FCCE15A